MNKIKYVLSILAVLALVSCAKDEPTRLTDVTGLIPDLDFTLIDENNKTATANDFLGYSVALFFGFTNCPDIFTVFPIISKLFLTRLGFPMLSNQIFIKK